MSAHIKVTSYQQLLELAKNHGSVEFNYPYGGRALSAAFVLNMNYSRVAHFMEIGGLTVYQKPTVKFFKRSKNRKLPSQLEDTTQPTP
jgi:hypothetical protein